MGKELQERRHLAEEMGTQMAGLSKENSLLDKRSATLQLENKYLSDQSLFQQQEMVK